MQIANLKFTMDIYKHNDSANLGRTNIVASSVSHMFCLLQFGSVFFASPFRFPFTKYGLIYVLSSSITLISNFFNLIQKYFSVAFIETKYRLDCTEKWPILLCRYYDKRGNAQMRNRLRFSFFHFNVVDEAKTASLKMD